MSSIILPRRFKEKPATIASIDKSILAPKSIYYPFTSGAPTVDQFNGTVGSFSGSCRANPYGIVTASGDYLTGNSVRPLFKGSTFTAVFEVTLNTLSGTHSAIIGTSGDQFLNFEIWYNGGGYVAINANLYIAGSYRNGPSVGFLSTIDNTVRVGLAFAWQQPYFKLYVKHFPSGKIMSSTSAAYGAPLDDRGGGLLFGKNHAGTQPFDGSIRYFLATEKYLSQDEIVRIIDDPWQIFKRRPQVLYFDVGGGGSVDLAGNAAAQATASATLTHAVPLAGAGLSVATATGALSVSIPLAAAAQSQAAAAATLTTSGSAALAGNATAQANATGGLGLSVPLSGAAVAQALAQAGLAHGVPLAGAASGQAAAGGALTLNISLSGAAISQAAASAGLTVLGASDLAGNATAQAAASAALTHAVPLSGASVVVGNASGSLSHIVPVAGAAASASMATGGLDVAVRLSAAALAQALAAAGLTVTASGMAGAAAADASAGGTLTLRVNLEGAAIANAIASGALGTAGLILASTPGYTVTRNRRDYSVSRTPRTWRISA